MQGIWEAIGAADGVRVFRMDFVPEGESFLAIASFGSDPVLLRLIQKSEYDGHVVMLFSGFTMNERDAAHLDLEGVVFGELGRMTGTIRMTLGGGPEQIWPVEFFRFGGISREAKRVISEARARSSAPPLPSRATPGPLPRQKLRP
jgi:hypothetical protein